MEPRKSINIAIVGVGNCASSLVQGLAYYRDNPNQKIPGLMHADLGGYKAEHIHIVAALDIDSRKVSKDLSQAIFSPPNCTKVFCKDVTSGVTVSMGVVLDGVSEHMKNYPADKTFIVSEAKEPSKEQIISLLKKSDAEILVNYLPVGSEKATRFYAECALEAGLGFINNIPVFIASDHEWAKKFKAANLPLMGDDIKSQLGATIVHRTLVDLFTKRGIKLEKTYQLNTGGNTDFLNMLNRERLESKKISKTEAILSVCNGEFQDNIHVGPSDYIPWLNDNKLCFLRIEGSLFGDVPMNLELRLSVEDSPNSAGVVIDAIRCCKLAIDRRQGGILEGPSSYFYKHPPRQYADSKAADLTEEFIMGYK
jgi:myo-inositol-1-phosphate synthase